MLVGCLSGLTKPDLLSQTAQSPAFYPEAVNSVLCVSAAPHHCHYPKLTDMVLFIQLLQVELNHRPSLLTSMTEQELNLPLWTWADLNRRLF